MVHYYPLFVIGLAWLGAFCIWLAGDRRKRLLHTLAICFSSLTGLAALGLFTQTSSSATTIIPMGAVLGDFTLVPDGLGVTIAVIAAVIGCLAVVFARDYMQHDQQQLRRFYALILFFIGAMLGLGLSGNLLFTFFFWEITALCSYALISFHNDDPKAVSGGIKALIMTQFGGVGLLAGALLLYSYQGNYQINQFLANTAGFPAGVLSVMAFGCLVAAAAKSAQVPFHTWLPDAMEAPTPVTALIHAATMVNAGVYLLARFYPAFAPVPGWRIAVMLVGAASALLAGLMAVTAMDIKRVLAYSTISQLGFMVYAVGSGAIFASQFHLLSHAIFKALLFLSAGALITALETRDLQQMGGLGRKMPFVRTVFVIGAAGLVGLPLANGFISKDMILEGGLAGGPFWLYLVMLFSAGVTALYTLRLYRLIFSGEPRGPEPSHDGMPAMRVSLSLLALGTLTSWLLAGPLSALFSTTLPAHHIEAEGTWSVVLQILTNPITWITLAVIGLGFSLWAARRYFVRVTRILSPLLASGFGFDWFNLQVVRLADWLSGRLQTLQTGQLNWNIAGLLGGLILLLVLLMEGADMQFPTFLWIILIPVLAAPVIYLTGRLARRTNLLRLPGWLAFLALLGACVTFFLAARQLAGGEYLVYRLGSVSLQMDGIGLLLAAVALGLGTLVTLYSGPYMAREHGQEKFYAMLLLMIGMIVGLGCAADLFNLWIWFEAMAITSYLLVAFYREQSTSLEAGFKYLVQSAAGSVLVVTGIALVFAASGTLELAQIRHAGGLSLLNLAGGGLMVIGFGVKAALVPLHTWLPDAHSQAPSGISAMLSGVVIEAGLLAMLRALAALFAVSGGWYLVLIGFAVLNMLVGNLMALRQTQVKRLLAYSSLAQVGYMLLGMGITFYSGLLAGAQGGLFHLLTHALMKGLAFLAAGALLYCLHISTGDHAPLVVNDLAGAAQRYPLVALGLSLALLGLGGLPPLAGFMSKWQIFVAGFQTRNIWMELLVIFAALNSVLSLAYYAPLVNRMYRLQPSERVQKGTRVPISMSIPIVILSLGVILLGIWPNLVSALTAPATQALLASIGG